MAKYYGVIGFAETVETATDVWEETIVEREYCGDVVRNTRRRDGGTSMNDDISVNNSISIVADPYAINNFFAMRYLTWMGVKWKITEIEEAYPRLNLSIGGVYNG